MKNIAVLSLIVMSCSSAVVDHEKWHSVTSRQKGGNPGPQKTFVISGTITQEGNPNMPFANVFLRAISSDNQITAYSVTRNDGYYEITVPDGWSGTVEPVGLVVYNVDKGSYCTTDADCNNNQFCDGVETCVNNNCQSGQNPCSDSQTCQEVDDTCM